MRKVVEICKRDPESESESYEDWKEELRLQEVR